MPKLLQKNPELLAPAGSVSALQAALRFGANSVYLACDRFGMRARAQNFSLGEMPEVVSLAHNSGASVAVTLNTIMHDDDLSVLPEYLEALAASGVDRFIVADLGAFTLAQRHAPSVDLCISTQQSISNATAARMWHELGAKRIVCARELSMEDIATLRANTPKELEIETFVHGAMCVAFSGRCLLSAAMCGRSGNRGECAQSCRWSYGLIEEQRPGQVFPIEQDEYGTYILNAEDMCMLEHLDKLRSIGVDSLKIEGRNKQAFYVATVVGAYRSVLDGGEVGPALEELQKISHRPYGTGFYFGEPLQSGTQDGYIKEWVQVATVEDCVAANGAFEITVSCNNHFEEGDQLEVVTPGLIGKKVTVTNLRRHSPIDGKGPYVERPETSLEEVRASSVLITDTVANRSKEHYVFVSESAVQAGDFLRRPV